MKPAKIIKANMWVNPKVGVPHDNRLVFGFNSRRDPKKFLCYVDRENLWWHEEAWPMVVDRWRDLPDDPKMDLVPIVPVHNYPLSAFGVNLHIDSWFPHLDWGCVQDKIGAHGIWIVKLRDGVLSASEIIKVTEFIWQQKSVGICVEWVIE